MVFKKKKRDRVVMTPEARAIKRINKLRRSSVDNDSVVRLNNILRIYLHEKFKFPLSMTVEEIIPRLDKKRIKRSVKLDLAHLIIQVYKREYYDPSPPTPKEIEMLTRVAFSTLETIGGRHEKGFKSEKGKEKKGSKQKGGKPGFFARLFTKTVDEEKAPKKEKVSNKKEKKKKDDKKVEEKKSSKEGIVSKTLVKKPGPTKHFLRVTKQLEDLGNQFHPDWSNEEMRVIYAKIRKEYQKMSDKEKKKLYPRIMNLFRLKYNRKKKKA